MGQLTSERIPAAARLLARAFFDNPAHVYLCPDARRREAQLVWLLGANLRLQPDLESSFCVARGDHVDAMGFWTRPGAAGARIVEQIREGLLFAPLRLGVSGVRRLAEVSRGVDGHRDEALAGQDFWYLNNMAVCEKLRGTGVGTRLLEHQLRVLGERTPHLPAALATQRVENTRFYRRLGFEVVSEASVGRGDVAFRNWIMLRSVPR